MLSGLSVPGLLEEVPRLQVLVVVELERAAVDVVGAGFGDHRDRPRMPAIPCSASAAPVVMFTVSTVSSGAT